MLSVVHSSVIVILLCLQMFISLAAKLPLMKWLTL